MNNDNNLQEPGEDEKYSYYEYLQEMDLRVGFGKRLAALLIDFVILYFINIILASFGTFAVSQEDFMKEYIQLMDSKQYDMIVQLVDNFLVHNQTDLIFIFLMPLVYYSLEIFIGASLGKLILGLRIASPDRTPAPAKNLAIRYSLKHISMIIYVLWIITLSHGLILVSFLAGIVIIVGFFFTLGERKQGLHDMIARTAVFHKRDLIES